MYILSGIAIILLAMSFSFSSFINTFAQTGNSTENVDCGACHVREKDELELSQIHKFKCTICHQISNFNLSTHLYTHTGITLECIFCHDWVPDEIQDEQAAHKLFYNAGNKSTVDLIKSNVACVACHTHIGAEVEWSSYKSIIMNISFVNDTELIEFGIYGTNVTNHTYIK